MKSSTVTNSMTGVRSDRVPAGHKVGQGVVGFAVVGAGRVGGLGVQKVVGIVLARLETSDRTRQQALGLRDAAHTVEKDAVCIVRAVEGQQPLSARSSTQIRSGRVGAVHRGRH